MNPEGFVLYIAEWPGRHECATGWDATLRRVRWATASVRLGPRTQMASQIATFRSPNERDPTVIEISIAWPRLPQWTTYSFPLARHLCKVDNANALTYLQSVCPDSQSHIETPSSANILRQSALHCHEVRSNFSKPSNCAMRDLQSIAGNTSDMTYHSARSSVPAVETTILRPQERLLNVPLQHPQ